MAIREGHGTISDTGYTPARETLPDGAEWKYVDAASIPYGKPDYTHWAPGIVRHDGPHHPSVIQLADKTWRMWYKNERAKDGTIYFADSPDLYHWTDKGVALPGSRGEGPKAFRWKNSYWLVVDVWGGLAVYRSKDCLNWTLQDQRFVQQPGTIETDRTKGNHADVVVSGDRAYLFYFTHQEGKDAENKGPGWSKNSVIQVAELDYNDGILTCDRNKPVRINLLPATPAEH